MRRLGSVPEAHKCADNNYGIGIEINFSAKKRGFKKVLKGFYRNTFQKHPESYNSCNRTEKGQKTDRHCFYRYWTTTKYRLVSFSLL